MDARVIVPFRDAERMEDTYYEGDTFSGSAERVASLAARGFVVPLEPEPAPAEKPAKKASSKAKPKAKTKE